MLGEIEARGVNFKCAEVGGESHGNADIEQQLEPLEDDGIGMALVMATALITGLVVANWTGNETPKPVTSAYRGSVRRAAATPLAADVDACNQYARSQTGSGTVEVLKDALIGGAIGAGVGAAGGAIAGKGGKDVGKGAAVGGANDGDGPGKQARRAEVPAMRRVRHLSLVLAWVLALWAGQALAEAPTDQLRESVDKVIKILEDPALKSETKTRERRSTIRQVAGEIFDFGESAKRSLARHWQSRTDQEREEFASLFGELLERSYISRIELYKGEKIVYAGEAIDGDLATVWTLINTRRSLEVPVAYRMHRRGDRWFVYDVAFEGVSLVAHYRAQFNKIIQASSYEELVKKLKAKQGELAAREGETTTVGVRQP